jgi:carbohydrate kinase (thermoresistant glucokinase family)
MGQAIIIMGVCGTGKTTVGEALAERLGCPFLEGDRFHPPENVAKMSAGTPLDDDDRWPWLDRLGMAIAEAASRNDHVIASCSALKRAYRDRLRLHTGDGALFVLLSGERDLLQQRLQDRPHHYMPSSLLDSQLAILEPPAADEKALKLNVDAPSSALVQTIQKEVINSPSL